MLELTTGGGARVTGVAVRDRGDRQGSTRRELAADLVVDASGRTSRCPDWLEALGCGRPEQTRVDSFLGYASRQYAPPPGWRSEWKAIFLMAKPPSHARTGFLFPIEGGRWMVTSWGPAGTIHRWTTRASWPLPARCGTPSSTTRSAAPSP